MYLRYADDFIVLADNPDELMGYFVEINRFLKTELKLEIHPNKIQLRKLSWGIDFVGYVALPRYNLPRKTTAKRIWRLLNENVASYLGYLSHANGHRLTEKLRSALLPTG